MHAPHRNPALCLLLIVLFSCSTSKNFTATEELQKNGVVFPKTDSLLLHLLRTNPFLQAQTQADTIDRQVQIIYTQINRDKHNRPSLTHHYYNTDPYFYFYPASTVKMPAAILSLQKINTLNIAGLNKHSFMITDKGSPEQTEVKVDSTSESGKPSVAHYLKKIFLVSDNDAYNRLYEFLGQEYLNQTLWKMGFRSAELQHRLSLSLTQEQNRVTNPITFYDSAGRQLYGQRLQKSNLVFPQRQTFLGRGYMSKGKLVTNSFDFSTKNRISLPDLHSILQTLVLPESVQKHKRFQLTDDDYRFLYQHMSMTPGESMYPKYDSTYTDAYVKFFLFGGGGKIEDKNVRIFNKVGDAYGFLQDVAYVVDFKNGVEFLLSATIYCNSDGIFNDDKYDYDSVGFPFFKHLGNVIYQYELQRPKKFKPDLSRYQFDYGHQP